MLNSRHVATCNNAVLWLTKPNEHRRSRYILAQGSGCLGVSWGGAGIIEADFRSSHDWRGRPRMVTGGSGAVSADHGRCSDMGALLQNKNKLFASSLHESRSKLEKLSVVLLSTAQTASVRW